MIGNGFDLYHGLPTVYIDFLNFIKYVIDGDFMDDQNKFDLSDLKKFIKENTEQVSLIKKLDDNMWYNYFKQCCQKNQGLDGKTWIDFETEIKYVVEYANLKHLFELPESSIKDMQNELAKKMTLVSEKISYSNKDGYEFKFDKQRMLNDLNELTCALAIYLHDFVEQLISDNKEKYQSTFIKKNFGSLRYVLSFNYTHTFKEIYGFLKSINYCYIHGEDVNNGKNMVLGIDEYLDEDEKNEQTEFVAFKKFFQRIVKGTDNEYGKWIKQSKDDYDRYCKSDNDFLNNLFIIGHSLDVTDRDVIYKLINNDFMQTTVYYYDQTDLENKVINLMKVIGEDDLIAKTSTNQIKFEQLPEEKLPKNEPSSIDSINVIE